MISDHLFPKAGRAAMHASELFARQEGEEERLGALSVLASAWGTQLCKEFCELTSGKLTAEVSSAETIQQGALGEKLGRGAAGFAAYTCGRAAQTIHASISVDGLEDSLSDMFGGDQNPSLGDAPTNGISRASGLLRDRVARMLANALTNTLGPCGISYRLVHTGALPVFQTAGRGHFVIVGFALNGESLFPLTVKIALPAEGIDVLLIADRKRRATLSASAARSSPTASPWGDLPLSVKAILSDTRFPLSKLARLTPGMVIPLPINRKVPLTCEGRTLAFGSVGEMDDRIALRITDLVQGQ
ncbi:FliM/FliN family flagellar motor C-terminal domain-containing protein [Qipengyuania sp.]|uniref:FliM/FliN family flagellar motor C-terminal domain-containing protein n=1 Tax=Qipengyuania sp. TaxID=2004515 RepID=UPI0035C7BEBE